jgi:hypothetical protein
LRHFVAFERLIDPGCLADIKVATVALEARYLRRAASGAVAGRGVNLDPGIITPANLVLATTKNFAHRIYLSQGIYAEVTLLFRKQATVALEWTYPDFRSEMCQRFVLEARRRLLGGR